MANAIDACDEGGKLVIRTGESRDFRHGRLGVRIVVADNGVGIATEDQAKVFEAAGTVKFSSQDQRFLKALKIAIDE